MPGCIGCLISTCGSCPGCRNFCARARPQRYLAVPRVDPQAGRFTRAGVDRQRWPSSAGTSTRPIEDAAVNVQQHRCGPGVRPDPMGTGSTTIATSLESGSPAAGWTSNSAELLFSPGPAVGHGEYFNGLRPLHVWNPCSLSERRSSDPRHRNATSSSSGPPQRSGSHHGSQLHRRVGRAGQEHLRRKALHAPRGRPETHAVRAWRHAASTLTTRASASRKPSACRATGREACARTRAGRRFPAPGSVPCDIHIRA